MVREIFINSICLLTVIFGFVPPVLSAGKQYTTLGEADFFRTYSEIVTDRSPWLDEDIAVRKFSAQPETMRIPAGEISFRQTGDRSGTHLGRNTITVAILSNGIEQGEVKLSGDVHLQGKVIYTTKSLRRGTLLSEDDIKVVRQDVTMLGSGLVRNVEDVIGKQLDTSLKPGAILYKYHLKPAEIVKRGNFVTIVAQNENLKVTVPGEAKEAGALGEVIQVKNLMSRKVIHAKVINSGTVEVSF